MPVDEAHAAPGRGEIEVTSVAGQARAAASTSCTSPETIASTSSIMSW